MPEGKKGRALKPSRAKRQSSEAEGVVVLCGRRYEMVKERKREQKPVLHGRNLS